MAVLIRREPVPRRSRWSSHVSQPARGGADRVPGLRRHHRVHTDRGDPRRPASSRIRQHCLHQVELAAATRGGDVRRRVQRVPRSQEFRCSIVRPTTRDASASAHEGRCERPRARDVLKAGRATSTRSRAERRCRSVHNTAATARRTRQGASRASCPRRHLSGSALEGRRSSTTCRGVGGGRRLQPDKDIMYAAPSPCPETRSRSSRGPVHLRDGRLARRREVQVPTRHDDARVHGDGRRFALGTCRRQ